MIDSCNRDCTSANGAETVSAGEVKSIGIARIHCADLPFSQLWAGEILRVRLRLFLWPGKVIIAAALSSAPVDNLTVET
jgi:hypothetical protein